MRMLGRVSRIIPAYAGSTMELNRLRVRGPDHPRLCGEHHSDSTRKTWRDGSSPPMRGVLGDVRSLVTAERIIPAYAGSTTVVTPGWR